MGHVDVECQISNDTNDKQYGDWLRVVLDKFFQLRSSVEKEKEARLVSELRGKGSLLLFLRKTFFVIF